MPSLSVLFRGGMDLYTVHKHNRFWVYSDMIIMTVYFDLAGQLLIGYRSSW